MHIDEAEKIDGGGWEQLAGQWNSIIKRIFCEFFVLLCVLMYVIHKIL